MISRKTQLKGAPITKAAEKPGFQLAALPESAREALAYFLISTVPDEHEAEDECKAELMRRDRELSTGEVKEITAEEVFRPLPEKRHQP